MRFRVIAGVTASFLLLSGVRPGAAVDTRVIEAVRQGHHGALRQLLKERIDVNATLGDGATALMWAAYRNDPESVALLLRSGAAVDAANDLGVTPLLLAAGTADAPLVGLLLTAGADPNRDTSGEPPLIAAARVGRVNVVRSLLNAGARPDGRERNRGQTALMTAVIHRHPDIVRLLLESGADVAARSSVGSERVVRGSRYSLDVSYDARAVIDQPTGGNTALLLAAQYGEAEAALNLLAKGADANDTSASGISALVMAAHGGHGRVAEILLAHGADPNASGYGYTALHAAILRGDAMLVDALLKRNADVRARVRSGTPSRRTSRDYALDAAWIGATPYWLASRFGELSMMRTLLKSGADPRTSTADRTTPLIAAVAAGVDAGPGARDRRERSLDQVEAGAVAERRRASELTTLETVKLALEAGIDVNAENASGERAIHFAASKRFVSVVQILLDHGADVNVKNDRGQTPLRLALGESTASPGDSATADLLRASGARE